MDTLEAMRERRTIRHYDREIPVPMADIDKIVEAGLLAPTARDSQDIDITVVANKELIDKITMLSFNEWDEGRKNRWNNRKIQYGVENVVSCDAPCLIVLSKNERTDPQFTGLDAGIITSHILLAAKSLGYDTMCIGAICWGDTHSIEQTLGILQDSLILAIAVGRATDIGDKLPEKVEKRSVKIFE